MTPELIITRMVLIGVTVLLRGASSSKTDETKLQTSPCLLSEQFKHPSFKCWTSSVESDDGDTMVGAGSVCQRKGKAGDTYRCSGGQWRKASQLAVTRHRQKRGCGFLWLGSCGTHTVEVVNQPPVFRSCPSSFSVTAGPGRTQASVYWSTPSATDPDGTAPTVSQVYGPRRGSHLSEGRHSVRYTATDSKGSTDNCYFTVTVSVIHCSTPRPPRNGYMSCSGNPHNIYGSVCTHSCRSGYRLTHSSSVSCDRDGRWDRSFPTCAAVSCGTPGNVAGGRVVCSQGHAYQARCVIQCNSGFTHSETTAITCTASGHWTASAPCIDTEPPAFPSGCPSPQHLYSGPMESPAPVTWTDPTVTDNSGQAVTLTSDKAKGSLLAPGIHSIQINATDGHGNQASCSFTVSVEVRECSVLQPPANGHVNCTGRSVEGSTCIVTCDPGYEVQGPPSTTCLASKQWETDAFACEGVTCPVPSTSHGQFTCLQGHQYPAVCALICDPGFAVQDPIDIHCLENATWSQLGSCLDVQPPEFDQGCPPDIQMYAAKVGEETRAQWTIPHVIDNSGDVIFPSSDVISDSTLSVGLTNVTYWAVDASGNNKSCQFTVRVSALECQSPDTDPSLTTTAMELTCPDGHVYGAVCTLNCTHGYRLHGHSSITCEKDNNTQPPAMSWKWLGSEAIQPQCKEDRCPVLQPPKHGALSCYLGDRGWDCFMSCESGWDVPVRTDGRFVCLNSYPVWRPATVPDCVVRLLPGRVRTHSNLFYLTGTCNVSEEELRNQFRARMDSFFNGACSQTMSCVAENIEVTCGPVTPRRPRAASNADGTAGVTDNDDNDLDSRLQRARRQAGHETDHYFLITFHIVLPYEEGNDTSPEDTYENYAQKTEKLMKQMKAAAAEGHFNIASFHLVADEHSVGSDGLHAECPNGTVSKTSANGPNKFSCGAVCQKY